MARVRFRAKPESSSPVSYDTTLPTHSPIAIYYRQSTDAQVGNISTTLQTVDMVKYLQQQGWRDDLITMIDMDAGVSGTTKIDEREGMRLLFKLIVENKIGSVACQDEDRLFRDVTQIQVNVFIEACRAHNVRVITPTMVYHFSHELLGSFHARQFRFRSEMAADYITTVIRGKLTRAKQSLAMNGQWIGGPIPVGYMIDRRKTLPDGSRNEHYKKYAIFEQYAMVVREYFRLYTQFSGNVAQTLHYIQKHGPYYPDPTTCLPPEGFGVKYNIRPSSNGWYPKAIQSLIHTFTNPSYIGHWVVKDVVVRWNNHPPIVDEASFYYAFNRHSSWNLDGSDNSSYRAIRFNDRPSLDEERSVERPLLSGLIFSEVDGKERQVGTHWKSKGLWSDYYYTFVKTDGFSTPVWRKVARYFDAAVVDLLLSRLKKTFDYEVWEAELDASVHEVAADLKLKATQLSQLKTVMENLLISLGSLTTPQMIAAIEKRYQDAEIEHTRLSQDVSMMTAHINDIEKIKHFKDTYQTKVDNWETSSREVQREIVHAFVQKIFVKKGAKSGKLDLTIYWRDGSESKLSMSRTAGHGTLWLPQDASTLMELVESGASQLEIAEAFPDLMWKKIYHKYYSMTKKSLDLTDDHPVRKHESYNEYLKRIGCIGATSVDGS